MSTERVTPKHLTPGDVILVGPVFSGSGNRYSKPHPSEAPDRCIVTSIDTFNHTVSINLADGTHVSAGKATRFNKENS